MCFLRWPQKLTKSSPSSWHLLHNVKSTVKSSSIYTSSRIVLVPFLEELKTPKRHFEINWPLNKIFISLGSIGMMCRGTQIDKWHCLYDLWITEWYCYRYTEYWHTRCFCCLLTLWLNSFNTGISGRTLKII